MVSLYIATSAERRAALAERDAERRAEAAERRADERIRQSKVEAHNTVVDQVCSLADQAIAILEERQAYYGSLSVTLAGRYIGAGIPAEFSDVHLALADIPVTTVGPEIRRGVAQLTRLTDEAAKPGTSARRSPPEMVGWFGKWIAEIKACRDRIDAARL